DKAPPVWHQIMPSLSYAYGRLMLAYYDTRWDNQRSVLTCDLPPCTSLSQLTAHHQFIPGSGLINGFSAVFGPSISDPIPGIRHTIDVFGGTIDPSKFNGSPLPVPAIQISQYAYWENPSDQNQIEQGFYNPPNLPLFVQGQIPFIGDYIDVAGLSMILSGGSWKFNTQATDAPVFHVTWTDNRDVVPPPCVGADPNYCTEDWSQFVPPNGGNLVPSMYSSVSSVCPTCPTMQPICSPANSGYSGDRNQNIYTSRITSGLMVRFRENSKPLGSRRAFSLLVRNTKSPLSTTPLGTPSFYRIMLNPSGTPPVASCAIAGGTAAFPDGS